MRHRSWFVRGRAAIALSLALAACDGERVNGPDVRDPEGLAFRYDGALVGSYASNGDPVVGGERVPELGEWAIARPDSLGGLVIAGFEPGSEGAGSLFLLQLPESATGEYGCSEHGIDGGCHGRIFFGVPLDGSATTGSVYVISEGSVILNETTDDRVRGTFELTLIDASDPQRQLAVEDGVIDVAYQDDVTLANGIACLSRNLTEGTNQPCP